MFFVEKKPKFDELYDFVLWLSFVSQINVFMKGFKNKAKEKVPL